MVLEEARNIQHQLKQYEGHQLVMGKRNILRILIVPEDKLLTIHILATVLATGWQDYDVNYCKALLHMKLYREFRIVLLYPSPKEPLFEIYNVA